ncbi:hypothetical protein KAR91_72900 [Candidatus Pacearchaeota archaeon]|nr:hypothetical protein [Candidatus Pacearchaeota archaeon]
MAATPSDVKAINGSALADAAIDPFLDAAQCIIDNVSDCITNISATCADTAQSWLACHLMAVSGIDRNSTPITEEKFENYTTKWALSVGTGTGTMGTSYGQMANTLLNGCLVEADKRCAVIAFGGGVC